MLIPTATAAIGFLIGASVYVFESIQCHQVEWPDASAYSAMGRCEPMYAPYWRRWLLPKLLGESTWKWQLTNMLAIGAMGAMVNFESGDWRAAWFLSLLPGVSWICAKCPKLVDAASMALAMLAALLLQHSQQIGWKILAVVVSLLAGAAKESSPVFAAIYAGNPILLIGLLGARWLGASKSVQGDPWAQTSWKRLAMMVRSVKPMDWRPQDTIFGFGTVLVLAAMGARWDMLTYCTVASLIVATAQGLIAHDRTRLTMWAAPMLVLLATRAPDTAIQIGFAVHVATPRVI